MIDLRGLKDRFNRIGVLGLGVGGQAVLQALQHSGLSFSVWDDSQAQLDKAAAEGLSVLNIPQEFTKDDLVIRSVGIPPHNAGLQKLEANSVPVWNDLDLLYLVAPKARYVGITGTNGKSTTTALIAHILKENGLKVAMGGNIGIAAPLLPTFDDDGIYVLELSSFQLYSAKLLKCDVAACLNVTEDHLDYHPTMKDYVDAKMNIFTPRMPGQTQYAAIGIDTPLSKDMHDRLAHSSVYHLRGITQNATEPMKGQLSLIGNVLYDDGERVAEWTEHNIIKGVHNNENRLIAYAACRALGLTPEQILSTAATFTGLKHRQQPVGQKGDIQYINDSKATNADATAKALAVYDNVYWILGGKDKSDGIDGLDLYYPHVKKAYLIGAATERFAEKLNGQLPYAVCDTIANAVRMATDDATKNGGKAVILLSPACASFDQYQNFEQRGDDFITHVETILSNKAAA